MDKTKIEMSFAIKIAETYIGKKELHNNSGFEDKNFETDMKNIGWKQGDAWCAYFAKLVWIKSFPQLNKLLNKCFSGNVIRNITEFSKQNEFVLDKIPELGALAIFQTYKNSLPCTTGHMGIVVEINGEKMTLIEGNTNANGGREGIEVAKKIRYIDFSIKKNGLVLLKFIKIRQ